MTIIEIIISLGITTISILAFMLLMSFGIEQFHMSIEQSSAEESLASSAYYLRLYMSQAVKVKCCRSGANCQGPGGLGPIPYPNYNMPVTAEEPQLVSEGHVDCQDAPSTAWVPLAENALGVFMRDSGGLAAGATAASTYRSTGVYFIPAFEGSRNSRQGANSGQLTIYDAAPGQPLRQVATFKQLVNINVVPGSREMEPSNFILKAITYQITARYFGNRSSVVADYQMGSSPNRQYRDISTNVKIVFRNNRLGESSVNGQTSERPLGQLYFFRLIAPTLGTL